MSTMILARDGFRRHFRTVRLLLLGVTLVLGHAISALFMEWDREGAKRAWEEACRDHKALSNLSVPTRENYLKVAKTYQTVYLKDPHYGNSDDAVYEAAKLFQEMGERFDNRDDFKRAVALFRFLATDYGVSPFCPDALLRLATVSETHLGDHPAAQSAYEQLLKRYPSSPAAVSLAAAGKVPVSPSATPSIRFETSKGERPDESPIPLSQADGKGDNLVLVRDLTFSSGQDFTRVNIVTDGPVVYSKQRLQNPERVFFDIPGAKLDRNLLNRILTVDDRFLKVVRIGQHRLGTVRVVLDLNGSSGWAIAESAEAFGLAIDIRDREKGTGSPSHPGAGDAASSTQEKRLDASSPSQSAAKISESGSNRQGSEALPASSAELSPVAAKTEAGTAIVSTKPSIPPPPVIMETHPAPKPALPTSTGDRTLTRMLGLKIGRIVLDPGHGGHDTGTIGPSGLLEKDLVLQVAKELQRLLQEKLGAEVVLTRSDDTFISLEDRTAIANKCEADLFLSIHANSSANSGTSGVETYFLDFARTDAAREVAARENATTDHNIRDLQNLIGKIARAEKTEESKELASVVQRNLFRGTRKILPASKNRGVRSAPFIVLIGANMPSVLTEVAFISNPRDEKQLKKEVSLQSLATSLFQGIEGYMKTLGTAMAQNRGNSN